MLERSPSFITTPSVTISAAAAVAVARPEQINTKETMFFAVGRYLASEDTSAHWKTWRIRWPLLRSHTKDHLLIRYINIDDEVFC